MPHGSQHFTALPSHVFRYDAYKLYKYNHTVPIYIFYATLCDTIDVSIQSRVPLPDLQQAFDEALAFLKK